MKFLHKLLVLCALTGFVPALAHTQPIRVSLPDSATGRPDSQVAIPIVTGDLTNREVLSYTAIVVFNKNVLRAQGASFAGTLSEPFGTPQVTLFDSVIVVTGTGATPLSGSGTLVKLNFQVVGQPGDTTALQFSGFLFNTGVPAAETTDGFFTVVAAPEPDISVTPNELDFGQILVDSSATAFLQIKNSGDTTLTVNATELSGPDAAAFRVTGGAAPFDLAAGDSQTVEVTFTPTTPGAKTAVLSVRSNDPDQGEVQVPLSGTALPVAVPDIDVSSTALQFGQVPVGGMDITSLLISNVGTAVLEVDAVRVVGDDADQFRTQVGDSAFQVAPSESKVVFVSFHPASLGTKFASLEIVNNDPDEDTVRVALEGEGVPALAPRIVVSPAQHDFGFVLVGDSLSQTFRLSNPGSVAVEVQEIDLTGAAPEQFTLAAVSVPFMLAAGDSQEVTVLFTPTSEGPKSAQLRIQSTDPENPVLLVPLQGTGVTPLTLSARVVSPSDRATVCDDSITVEVETRVSGAVPPVTGTCEVNGIAMAAQDGKFVATVPLPAGETTLVAACSATDSLGRQVTASDTVTVTRPAAPTVTLQVISPEDSTQVCGDSVDVAVQTTLSGGIGPFSINCDINGIAAAQTDSILLARVPLLSQRTAIVATCTVVDSCGNLIVAQDSVTVLRPAAPGCTVEILAPQEGDFFCEEDSITVTAAFNVTSGTPPFAVQCQVNGTPAVRQESLLIATIPLA
ncbi:MAG: choice-of-anchor D domain-containing protein, partial [Calditrichaeota bacterium]